MISSKSIKIAWTKMGMKEKKNQRTRLCSHGESWSLSDFFFPDALGVLTHISRAQSSRKNNDDYYITHTHTHGYWIIPQIYEYTKRMFIS